MSRDFCNKLYFFNFFHLPSWTGLNALPERKRDIILLSYFLDMSDAEIGELLNVVRTTVFRHRKSALEKIKQYLEGKADDEYR